ncbi:MAG: hypothetical protein ACYTBJ_14960 [Planctomycetota bacterium]|jgi:hypothetical protein
MNDDQISDNELNYMIDQFSDKWRKYAGPNWPIESALRELLEARKTIMLLQVQVSALRQENEALLTSSEMMPAELIFPKGKR